MKMINRCALALALLLSSLAVQAVDKPFKLPPLMFFSTLDDALLDSLKQKPIFSELDKELYGSPLRIGVIHTFAATAGGSASEATSAILAAGTLGIVPIVSNNDLVVTYTISAHGKKVASFSYTQNFTQASSLYSDVTWSKMDKNVKAWVLSTVDKFVADAGASPEVRELTSEYEFYFGAVK